LFSFFTVLTVLSSQDVFYERNCEASTASSSNEKNSVEFAKVLTVRSPYGPSKRTGTDTSGIFVANAASLPVIPPDGLI
jgi:hypothetical protein